MPSRFTASESNHNHVINLLNEADDFGMDTARREVYYYYAYYYACVPGRSLHARNRLSGLAT